MTGINFFLLKSGTWFLKESLLGRKTSSRTGTRLFAGRCRMDRHHRPAGCGILPLRGTFRNNRFRFGRPVVFRLRQYRHEKTPVGKDYLIPHLQLAANAGTPYIAPLSGDADLVADRTSLGCIRLCFNQRR